MLTILQRCSDFQLPGGVWPALPAETGLRFSIQLTSRTLISFQITASPLHALEWNAEFNRGLETNLLLKNRGKFSKASDHFQVRKPILKSTLFTELDRPESFHKFSLISYKFTRYKLAKIGSIIIFDTIIFLRIGRNGNFGISQSLRPPLRGQHGNYDPHLRNCILMGIGYAKIEWHISVTL